MKPANPETAAAAPEAPARPRPRSPRRSPGPPGEETEPWSLSNLFKVTKLIRGTGTESPALAEGTLTWGIFLKF